VWQRTNNWTEPRAVAGPCVL